MSIFIDGIIFSLQRYGGISVYFQHLLRMLDQHAVPTTLGLYEPLKQTMDDPLHSIQSEAHVSRLLERYRSCLTNDATSIFHSSYYRTPANTKIPTVVTVHDFVYERYVKGPKRWLHTAQKYAAIRQAQAIICISEATKEDLLNFVDMRSDQTITVIHNGVDNAFHKVPVSPPPKTFILFVGERRGYKNFALLLEALKLLPDIELHCVGGGTFRPGELDSLAPGEQHRVRHLGFLSNEELNICYNQALCLVYPSSYEGFGIPVAEAMKAGCPVVSLACKAVMEIGGSALTIAEPAPDSLANAILTTTNHTRSHIIETGLATSQKFSWDVTHAQTLALYSAMAM